LHSKKSKSNWIAITAGLLPENFERAAERVCMDLIGLYPFQNVLNFTSRDLGRCAPKTLEKYGNFLSEDLPGYGFFCWKPEMVDVVLNGEFGECDGIVWIDGGCEVFNSPWTRKKFGQQIQIAEKYGYLVFELDTPENRFSKSDVIDYFPGMSRMDNSPQVQATHFFLYGKTGKEIASAWVKAGLQGIEMFDHSSSITGDPEKFVLHKSDQSLLSLTIKSLHLEERMQPPPAGNRGALFRLSATRAPIWVSRNRDGISVKGRLLKFVERISK
jgi:hypothetical protein